MRRVSLIYGGFRFHRHYHGDKNMINVLRGVAAVGLSLICSVSTRLDTGFVKNKIRLIDIRELVPGSTAENIGRYSDAELVVEGAWFGVSV